MYKQDGSSREFENFYLPFGGKLSGSNRWVRMAEVVPWEMAEQGYRKHFAKSGQGAPGKRSRMALGALLIKETLGVSDAELVEQIRENPYLQYFIGLSEFTEKAPFDSSMMVHFRKRFPEELIGRINEEMVRRQKAPAEDDKDGDDDQNSGKLVVDATCAPADIRFPTDLSLLNEAREKSEGIIDELHAHLPGKERKVRTYREQARKDYLSVAKSKKSLVEPAKTVPLE